MKRFLSTLYLLLVTLSCFAQIGWGNLAPHQGVSFTDAQGSGFSLKAGQNHVSSKLMTKSEILAKYNVNSTAMAGYTDNQVVQKSAWMASGPPEFTVQTFPKSYMAFDDVMPETITVKGDWNGIITLADGSEPPSYCAYKYNGEVKWARLNASGSVVLGEKLVYPVLLGFITKEEDSDRISHVGVSIVVDQYIGFTTFYQYTTPTSATSQFQVDQISKYSNTSSYKYTYNWVTGYGNIAMAVIEIKTEYSGYQNEWYSPNRRVEFHSPFYD